MNEYIEPRVWRNQPGLNGLDGVGFQAAPGRTIWYTEDRAREVIAQLQAGLDELAKEAQS